MTDHIRVYIAGPFFNSAQIDVIKSIERILDKYDVPYFSPRKLGLNAQPTTTKPTPEQAADIFKNDYQEICRSTHVLAVVDWSLPPGQSIHLHKNGIPETIGPPLNIPDSGTVWEMGCAYALRVPVILFTANPSKNMNLMLTQSAKGCLYGFDTLHLFAESRFNPTFLEGWKGEHR